MTERMSKLLALSAKAGVAYAVTVFAIGFLLGTARVRWQLTNAGRPSGEVVRALAWAGRPQAHEFLARIKRELPEEARKELVASRGALPEWLARTISAELAA